MTNLKTVVAAPKNFVLKHKTPIAFAAGAIITGVLADKLTKASFEKYDTFLESKDLVGEFIAFPLTSDNL